LFQLISIPKSCSVPGLTPAPFFHTVSGRGETPMRAQDSHPWLINGLYCQWRGLRPHIKAPIPG
jgi:hypothetical protein